eukprot:4112209-Pyramimonas_sp.AAC.1
MLWPGCSNHAAPSTRNDTNHSLMPWPGRSNDTNYAAPPTRNDTNHAAASTSSTRNDTNYAPTCEPPTAQRKRETL